MRIMATNCLIPARSSENLVVTRLFRRLPLTMAVACVVGLVGCGPVKPWTIVARTPQVHIDVSAGCPMSLNDWQDVRNTGEGLGSELVPPNPVAALICRYRGNYGGPSVLPLSGRTLYRQVILETTTSRQLATSIAAISLARPPGSLSCPNGNGSASVLTFAYPGRQDVDLWYDDSGCATLDNGKTSAIIDGNPPFYQGFAPLLDRLAPPE
jgi:hypothetical protein